MSPPHAQTLHRACVCLAWAALAEPALAGVPCNLVSFTATLSQATHTARIKPGPGATFVSGDDDCPNNSQSCRQKEHVVPGDVVPTGVTHAAFTCAYHTRLQTQPHQATLHTAWLGTWQHGDGTLAITQAGQTLSVSARACWPDKAEPNGHEGSLAAQANPVDNTLILSDADDPRGCRLALTLLAPEIVARDNGRCGGANVTLSGLYRRHR